MKRIIIILTFLYSNVLLAQNWSYKSSVNAFDGKYRTASIIGKGNDYPYHKPMLVINLFNENSLNFYIADAGYYQSLSDIEILWVFSNEPNTIYKSYNFSKSEDGKIIFFDDFKNLETGDYIYKLNFIDKLKAASKVDVRIKNNYGKNDIVFSLSGSTKAINFVITKKYKDKAIALRAELEKIAKERMEKKVEVYSKILLLINNVGIKDDEESSALFDEIERKCSIYDIEMDDIDSLNVKVDEYSAHLNLFKNDGTLLKELKYIGIIIPKYVKEYKEQEFNNNYTRIEPLIERFGLNDKEKKKVCEQIISVSERNEFKVSEIDSLKINILSIMRASIEIFDKNKTKLKGIEVYIPDYIEKKSQELEDNGTKRVDSLLNKFSFTQDEKDKIIKEIRDYQLQDIEQNKVDNVKFNFLSYATDIKFLNGDKEIEIITIYDKILAKELKKKIRKFEKN